MGKDNLDEDITMTNQQYTDLTNAIKGLRSEVHKIHGKFSDLDQKVTSISNFINGDPNLPGTTGANKEIETLRQRVAATEIAVTRIERIDTIETKVDTHEKKLNTIWTVYFTVAVIAAVVGALLGIFVPITFT